MPERDLRQQIEGIFSPLNQEVENSALLVLDGVQSEHRLSGLFSNLEESGAPVAVERATHLLKSRQLDERRRAVQRLGQLHNEWTVTPLLQAVTDKEPEIAQLALEALRQLGDIAGE